MAFSGGQNTRLDNSEKTVSSHLANKCCTCHKRIKLKKEIIMFSIIIQSVSQTFSTSSYLSKGLIFKQPPGTHKILNSNSSYIIYPNETWCILKNKNLSSARKLYHIRAEICGPSPSEEIIFFNLYFKKQAFKTKQTKKTSCHYQAVTYCIFIIKLDQLTLKNAWFETFIHCHSSCLYNLLHSCYLTIINPKWWELCLRELKGSFSCCIHLEFPVSLTEFFSFCFATLFSYIFFKALLFTALHFKH